MAAKDMYKVEDGKLVRTHKECPKCPGAYMAQHNGRQACGKCGYTEFDS